MGTFIDLSGKQFGHWTVIERDNESKKKNIYWICKCDCGTVRSVAGTSLRSGISVSCGCDKDKKTSIRTKTNVEDLSGQRFGRWTVIEQDLSDYKKSKRGSRWICRCDCGKEKSVSGSSLRKGSSTSCGCQSNASHIIDITGERYGKLVVLKKDTTQKNNGRGIRWICKCDCGNEVSVLSGRLRSGQTKSCGCLRYETKKDYNDDLAGQIFGKWTVLKKDESKKGKGTYYVCQCECGTIRSITPNVLKKGLSKSCGCGKSVPKNDLVGQKFGKLLVIGLDEEKRGKGIHWICKCECGNTKSYRTVHLTRGKVISCGCETRKNTSKRLFNDISNNRFGRLVVLQIDHKEYDNNDNTEYYWKCQCDCGNIVVVRGISLRRGDTKSCGCLQSENSAKRTMSRTIDLVGKKFGLLTVVERVSKSDDNNLFAWRCICECGNEKIAEGYHLRRGMVSSCGCLSMSRYELYVLQYFEEKNYENTEDFESQKRFDDLRGYDNGKLSYDFAFYKNGKLCALIECQGQQHFKPVGIFGGEEQFAKQQLHDEIKREYAKKIGVQLIEIPFTVESYDEVKDILASNDI